MRVHLRFIRYPPFLTFCLCCSGTLGFHVLTLIPIHLSFLLSSYICQYIPDTLVSFINRCCYPRCSFPSLCPSPSFSL